MKTRLLIACILLVFLPVLAIAAGAAAMTPELLPGLQAAEALADKSMAYWFVCLAVVSIGSWTWVFKWMIQQLSEQRTAHADATRQLVGYLTTDHTMMVQVVTKATDALEQVSHKLKQS